VLAGRGVAEGVIDTHMTAMCCPSSLLDAICIAVPGRNPAPSSRLLTGDEQCFVGHVHDLCLVMVHIRCAAHARQYY